MKYDHIFFDSGGTLYATGKGLTPAPSEVAAGRVKRVLAAFQGQGLAVPPESLAAALAHQEKACPARLGTSYTYFHLLVAVLADLGLAVGPEQAACLADAYAGPRYGSWLYPGTLGAVARLHQHGYRLGVIANTAWPGFCMDRAFAGVGLLPYFGLRLYSGDLGLAKPDPAIFHLAERYAGLTGARKRILYVGNDPEKDIRAATAVGWSTAQRLAADEPSPGLAGFEFTDIQALLVHCLAD
jgi:FMN phosphatase YigB (HAD superfamily)